jgi:hypothetical protein
LRDVVNPYAQEFAFSFATTYATVGIGSFGATQLSRVLQKTRIVERLAAKSDLFKITARLLTRANNNEGLKRNSNLREFLKQAVKKFEEEFKEEVGDEIQENTLEKFLNSLSTGLAVTEAVDGTVGWGNVAAVLLTITKGTRIGKSTMPFAVKSKEDIPARAQVIKLDLEKNGAVVTDLGKGYMSVDYQVLGDDGQPTGKWEKKQLMPEVEGEGEARPEAGGGGGGEDEKEGEVDNNGDTAEFTQSSDLDRHGIGRSTKLDEESQEKAINAFDKTHYQSIKELGFHSYDAARRAIEIANTPADEFIRTGKIPDVPGGTEGFVSNTLQRAGEGPPGLSVLEKVPLNKMINVTRIVYRDGSGTPVAVAEVVEHIDFLTDQIVREVVNFATDKSKGILGARAAVEVGKKLIEMGALSPSSTISPDAKKLLHNFMTKQVAKIPPEIRDALDRGVQSKYALFQLAKEARMRGKPELLKPYLKEHDVLEDVRVEIAENLLGRSLHNTERTALLAAHDQPGAIDEGNMAKNIPKLGTVYDAIRAELQQQGMPENQAHEQAMREAKLLLDAGLAGAPQKNPTPPVLIDGVPHIVLSRDDSHVMVRVQNDPSARPRRIKAQDYDRHVAAMQPTAPSPPATPQVRNVSNTPVKSSNIEFEGRTFRLDQIAAVYAKTGLPASEKLRQMGFASPVDAANFVAFAHQQSTGASLRVYGDIISVKNAAELEQGTPSPLPAPPTVKPKPAPAKQPAPRPNSTGIPPISSQAARPSPVIPVVTPAAPTSRPNSIGILPFPSQAVGPSSSVPPRVAPISGPLSSPSAIYPNSPSLSQAPSIAPSSVHIDPKKLSNIVVQARRERDTQFENGLKQGKDSLNEKMQLLIEQEEKRLQHEKRGLKGIFRSRDSVELPGIKSLLDDVLAIDQAKMSKYLQRQDAMNKFHSLSDAMSAFQSIHPALVDAIRQSIADCTRVLELRDGLSSDLIKSSPLIPQLIADPRIHAVLQASPTFVGAKMQSDIAMILISKGVSESDASLWSSAIAEYVMSHPSSL